MSKSCLEGTLVEKIESWPDRTDQTRLSAVVMASHTQEIEVRETFETNSGVKNWRTVSLSDLGLRKPGKSG